MKERECWWRFGGEFEWVKGQVLEWQVHKLACVDPSRPLKTVTCGLVENTNKECGYGCLLVLPLCDIRLQDPSLDIPQVDAETLEEYLRERQVAIDICHARKKNADLCNSLFSCDGCEHTTADTITGGGHGS